MFNLNKHFFQLFFERERIVEWLSERALKMQSNDEEINMKMNCALSHHTSWTNFMARSKQNKTKSHTWNQSEAFRGLRHKFSPNKHKFSNISSRKHIIQMRRTCRSCNYLRFRTGTNLLTAFSIETTLVEKKSWVRRDSFVFGFPFSLVRYFKGKRKLFLLANVFATLHDCNLPVMAFTANWNN